MVLFCAVDEVVVVETESVLLQGVVCETLDVVVVRLAVVVVVNVGVV